MVAQVGYDGDINPIHLFSFLCDSSKKNEEGESDTVRPISFVFALLFCSQEELSPPPKKGKKSKKKESGGSGGAV